MNLIHMIRSTFDEYLCSSGTQKDTPDLRGVEKEDKVPRKFQDDITALEKHFGELKTGLCIDTNLKELLAIIPRKRRRTDAYNALRKYPHESMEIDLNISKNEKT